MTNEQIKYHFQGNKCFKFDGNWNEFQEFIQSHGISHATLKVMDIIYFDCLDEDLPINDDRVTEIV